MFKIKSYFSDMNLHKVCFVIATLAITQALAEEKCPDDHVFVSDVSHGMHSIKINNIQFYFDKNFSKIDNGIPTLNPNLTDVENDVLDNAIYFKSDFKQMGLQEMDFIMSQNGPDFIMRLANPLEKIGHALHMNDVWAEAGLAYQDFVKNPPNCECLQENLIKKYLKTLAIMMRAENEKLVDEKSADKPKVGSGYYVHGGYNRNHMIGLDERKGESSDHKYVYVDYILGTMEGPEQWDYYRRMLLESVPEERATRNMAKFLYCKINNNSD
jgi:hypothetical protein